MRPNSGGTTDYAFVPLADERVFLFACPRPSLCGRRGRLKEQKDEHTLNPEPAIRPPETRVAAAKSQQARVTCLQEQFSGPLPERSERSMAEILAERLAEARPDSPCPMFIP